MQDPAQSSVLVALVSGLTDLHHLRVGEVPDEHPDDADGRRSRADSSATEVGVWHSSTILRSSGVACRPSWSVVISASTGAWSSMLPSDEAVRPRVRTYGRTTPRRTRFAVLRVLRVLGFLQVAHIVLDRLDLRGLLGVVVAVDGHRIAERGNDVCSSDTSPGVSALAHFSTRTAIS